MNYLEIIKNVVNNGVPKQATRYDNDGNVIPVENGTIGTFCEIFRHDMSTGFPLTTLRQMPWRSIRVELEGFIKGITKKSWYKDQKCNFWNEWANPVVCKEIQSQIEHQMDMACEGECGIPDEERSDFGYAPTLKEIQAEEDDLGPIYGYQWRSFGKNYNYDNWEHPNCFSETEDLLAIPDNPDGLIEGYDQLKSIVDKLHNSPYDRRMVCSAWNPNQMDQMALPSCHVLHQVVVYGNKLNLTWFQRSCDLTHGVPANIASYALLLLLYCEESGLEPGELVGVLSDCHIYENTIDSAKKLIEREEKELPTVKIKRKEDGSFSIFDWKFSDVETIKYDPHPAVNMGSVTV